MRICLFFLITVFLMACSSTGNQRQEPENQTLETILNRKSVRKYKDRPVEKEKIDKLIRAGMAAPSSRDRRPWEFIIVTDRKAWTQWPKVSPSPDAERDKASDRRLRRYDQILQRLVSGLFRRLAKPATCRRIHGIGSRMDGCLPLSGPD